MKMKKDLYGRLKELVLLEHSTVLYEKYKAHNLSDMRYRWDVLQKARMRSSNAVAQFFYEAYEYLNDDHIDTALRNILGHKK